MRLRDRRIIGHVIDPAGRPVAGARVEANGVRTRSSSSYSSNTSGNVDPMAVTDETGGFFLDCSSSVDAISVTVEASRLTRRRLWLTPGNAHLIRLPSGVTVSGTVLESDKPVPDTLITMDTADRTSPVFMRGFEVATDKSGRFALTHVPAETRFRLYTPLKELEDVNAGVPAMVISTPTNGGTLALGDLKMARAHLLRGRVLLSNGQTVPERTRITLVLDNDNDSRGTALDPDGWFEFVGVRAGRVSLIVRIPGYRVSARNPNKDWINQGRVVGRLQEDHDRFFIEFEPDEPTDAPPRPAKSEDAQPLDRPLRSAPVEG